MRNECVQMSLEDIYNDVSKSMEDKKPALIELLEAHIDFETIIPASFYNAFYQRYFLCKSIIHCILKKGKDINTFFLIYFYFYKPCLKTVVCEIIMM